MTAHFLETRDELTDAVAHLRGAVTGVVRGQAHAVDLVLAGLLSGGHVLLEDSPGTGKTTLARAVATAAGADFRRLQGTPDLLPADVTGTGVWDPEHRRFTFVPGPVFTNVLLVDELNRATPRCQSAVLEAMSEGTVTVDGVSHRLPDPFLVLATQNPYEQHGTYPLPEGQLDRFALLVHLAPLDGATEARVLREQLRGATVDALAAVTDLDMLRALRSTSRAVFVAGPVLEYAVALVRATRTHPMVELGASSRAAISLVRSAQGVALLGGRGFVSPEDVQLLAEAALVHRLTLSSAATATGEQVVADVVRQVPLPVLS